MRQFIVEVWQNFRDNHKRMTLLKRQAEKIIHRKQHRHRGAIFGKMCHVLSLETLWLKQVRYEICIGLREDVFNNFKSYVKYCKTKRLIRYNRYASFFEEAKKGLVARQTFYSEID